MSQAKEEPTKSTEPATSWRTEEIPEELLFAIDSWYSYDDFNKATRIYAGDPLEIDIFINNINLILEEHIQLSDHVADTFSVTCFGKAPTQVQYSGRLVDTFQNYGKLYLIDAWKNKLRLGAVARTGVVPHVLFGTHAIEGPFVSMRLNQTSDSADTLVVILTQLVTKITITGEKTPLVFDFTRGVETVSDDAHLVAKARELALKKKKAEEKKDEEVKPAEQPAEQKAEQSTTPKTEQPKPTKPDKPPYQEPAPAPTIKPEAPPPFLANQSTC